MEINEVCQRTKFRQGFQSLVSTLAILHPAQDGNATRQTHHEAKSDSEFLDLGNPGPSATAATSLATDDNPLAEKYSSTRLAILLIVKMRVVGSIAR